MTPHFNLVDEPFVPCRFLDGSIRDLRLLDTLVKAPEIAEISHGSPLVECALHLPLLAILHRVYGPPDVETWATMWRSDRLEEQPLGAYLDHWHHRFGLFDEERPFYQVPGFETGSPKPLTKLEMMPFNEPTLFYHTSGKEPPAFSFAEAARLLIAFQFFAIGFGRSATGQRKDGPATRGVTVLNRGGNLFETLMLNCPAYPTEIIGIPWTPADRPHWEREKPREPGTEATPDGYLDYLTWQSRAMRLVPDGERVQRLHLAQGIQLSETVMAPHSCCLKAERGMKRLGLSEGRALWRDSTALLRTGAEHVQPPLCARWAGRLTEEAVLPEDCRLGLRVYGMATKPGKAAKIDLWRAEQLPFPLSYLRCPSLVDSLQAAVSRAESAHAALRAGVRALARHSLYPGSDSQPDWGRVSNLAASLDPGAAYWPRLEGPFRELMVAMARPEADVEARALDWLGFVVRAARDAFRHATEKLDRSARNLRAATRARGAFEGALRKNLPEYFSEEVEVG